MNKKKAYYLDFYNNSLFRDFRYILNNKSAKIPVRTPYLPYNPNMDFKKQLMNFVLQYRNKSEGALVGSLSYFENIGNFRKKENKLTNMLFFDFDIDNDELTAIKKNIINEYSNNFNKLKEYKKEYKDLLLSDDELLIKPFNECMKLYNHFIDNNIKSYTVFSGSKGFHLYIFFNEIELNNINEISYKLAKTYKEQLNLTTLDLAVNKDAGSRVSRLPYSKHGISELYTTPFDFETDKLSDVISNSTKDTINNNDFMISNYKIRSDNFSKTLKQLDKNITNENELLKSVRIKNNTYNSKYIADNSKDDLFKDMRILLKLILGEPVREFKNYNSYNCPFHDDQSPSARVYKNNFLCATENLHLNYFDFIRKYFDLPDDDAVKDKMKELKKLVIKSKGN